MPRKTEKTKNESESKSKETTITKLNIIFYYSNIINYLRLFFILYSFSQVLDDPEIFLFYYYLSFIIILFQKLLLIKIPSQSSKLSTTLEMVINQISTSGLLAVLSYLYKKYSIFFIYLMMLNVSNHWIKNHSDFLGRGEERLWFWEMYEKNKVFKGLACLGSEMFLGMLYLSFFYPKYLENEYYVWFYYYFFTIFIVKQAILFGQMFPEIKNIGNWDAKVATKKLNLSKKDKSKIRDIEN